MREVISLRVVENEPFDPPYTMKLKAIVATPVNGYGYKYYEDHQIHCLDINTRHLSPFALAKYFREFANHLEQIEELAHTED